MNKSILPILAAAFGTTLFAGVAMASTVDVTPNIIFGSGNANGGFTVATSGTFELGLRAKLRYDLSGQPQNTFNYDSATNRYVFDPAASNAPANRSIFNFEWSIDTDTADADDTPSSTVGDYTYVLGVDTDPTAGVSYVALDPYALGGDHSFGLNSTANGDGLEDTGGLFASLMSTYNVSQQSWNMGFGFLGDPQQLGLYSIFMEAYDGSRSLVARTSIDVQVGLSAVPVPAAMPLLLAGMGGLALMRRRRKSA